MRIVHLLSAPAAGGAEIYIRDLARELVGRGHDVLVVFLSSAINVGRSKEFERKFIAELELSGVAVKTLPDGCRRNPLKARLQLMRQVKLWRAELIHVHLYQGLLATLGSKVPVVYTHHSMGSRLAKGLFRLLQHSAVKVHVGICYACADFLRRFSSVPVVQIDNAIDRQRMRSPCFNRSEKPFVVLAVGRLISLKRYDILVRSMGLLCDRNVVLHIAGEGPCREELERLANDLGLRDRVIFHGYVDDVSSVMTLAHVLAISSEQEGLPITLLESVHANLPFVVRNVGGCAEVAHKTIGGIVVDDAKPESFAEAFALLHDERSVLSFFRRRLSNSSDRYTIERSASEHLNMYSSLVTGEGGKRS